MQSSGWNKWIPWIGFILALVLRLWHLGAPPQIVSDEVFFVNDGWSYVTHHTYFDPHPPLGKIELGVVMKFFGYHSLVWRLVGAVSGALIIPLIWWIAWRLTKKHVVAHIAIVLALLDGLMLVDSRLGLINIPYILASLMSFACLLKALDGRRSRRWLFAAGTFIGMAVATKWLAVLVGIPIVALWIWPQLFGQSMPTRTIRDWWIAFFSLIVWPTMVYWLVFVWHFSWQGIPMTFFATNIQMLNYQLSVPSVGDPHSQPWWGWLLAWHAFPYWSDVQHGRQSTIQSLPNPWVWWIGSIFFLISLVRGWKNAITRLLNMLLLFAWIPFAFIQRVMYSYHALIFDVWLILLIAVVLEKFWFQHRRLVLGYLVIALAVFIWFTPWYLNIPLSPRQQKLRQWLPSWSVNF